MKQFYVACGIPYGSLNLFADTPFRGQELLFAEFQILRTVTVNLFRKPQQGLVSTVPDPFDNSSDALSYDWI